MKKSILLLFLFLFLSKITAQNPGDLMTDFGDGGKVLANFGIDPINVKKQIIQNDGKIVLVGSKEHDFALSGFVTFIIRLNPDGTPDTTFNSTGVVTNNKFEYFKTVKISAAGKIIIGGASAANGTQFILCQYNSDGSIDTSFGTTGVFNTSYSYSSGDLIDFDVQSSGKIVIMYGSTFRRFNTNGTADSTFNWSIIFPSSDGNPVVPKIIKIMNDDSIIVAGIRANTEVLIKKFNANGFVDTSFNSTGVFTAGFINRITSLDIASNGKIIFYSKYFISSGTDVIHRYYLVQLNVNGTLDTSFGTNGVVMDDVIIPGYSHPYPDTMALPQIGTIKFLPNGKSVILEEIFVATSFEKHMALVKHNADGTLDANFGASDGRIILSNFELYRSSLDFNLRNNKILISGNRVISPFENNIVLTQLNEDGSLDTSFDTDGESHLFLPYQDEDRINKMVLQPDNKIIAAGTTMQNFRVRAVLSRYNPNGTLDSSFGTNGKVFLDDPSTNPSNYLIVTTPIIDTDNKIILLLSYGGYSIMHKFNADGSLDSTFGTTGILDLSTYGIFGNDVKVDADNNIFVAGSSPSISNSNDNDFAIVKLNPEGIIDTSFGTNGTSNSGSSTVTTEELNFLQILPNGKLIACGNKSSNSVAVLKYESTGLLDTTFNGNGQAIITGSVIDIDVTDEAIFLLNYGNSVVKLDQNGGFDNTFGINGITTPNLNYLSVLNSLNVLPNGSLVLSGRYTPNNASLSNFLLVNFNSNGSHNLAFGNNGVVTTNFNGYTGISSDLVITNDYSVILGGVGVTNNNYMTDLDFAMVKIYIGNALANNEYIAEEVTTFYPNPASDLIYISLNVKSFTIYTLDGKKVKTSIQNQTIDVSQLSDGIYLIQAQLNNGQTVTEKLVIK